MKNLYLLCVLAAFSTHVHGQMEPATAPASVPSDAQHIRDVALGAMDRAVPLGPAVVESIVIESDLERQFVLEMLNAMQAEQSMFRRAAVAVTGDDKSEAVQRVEQAAAATRQAISTAMPVIDGDSATMPFAPSGGRGTTLAFRKIDGRWPFDLLRRYRERGQIDEKGIANWKSRQKAAEIAAKLYEDKKERDLSVLPLIYETMCRQLAEHDAKQNKDQNGVTTD